MFMGKQMHTTLCEGRSSSELRFDRACILTYQLFDLSELIIELQTFLIRQCVRRLDDLAGHNLLDGKLDFLEVDRRLHT